METIIYSCEELHQLSALFSPIKKVKLDLKSLTKTENQLFENKLNEQLNSCGCDIGKYTVVLTIAGYVTCSLLQFPALKLSYRTIIPLLIISAVAGKLLGLLIARLKIFIITRKIKKSLTNYN